MLARAARGAVSRQVSVERKGQRAAMSPSPKAAAAQPAQEEGKGGATAQQQTPQQPWIRGLTPNSQVVRALAVAGTVAVSGGSSLVGAKAASSLHLLSWGSLLGSIVFQTFVVGLALFKRVPRPTFRSVQEILFPRYFALNAACLAGTMATGALSLGAPNAQLATLGVGFAAVLSNIVVLEPKTSSVMNERAALEEKSAEEVPDKKEKMKTLGKQV